jgi:DNA-directed RNA polymerase subunit RPC12/RpoP
MSGRAQMPLRAFLKALERLTVHEASGTAKPLPTVNGQPLTFRMGELLARCGRCDGTEFAPPDPAQSLKLTSALVCSACGEKVIHGNLIAELAQDAVPYAHVLTATRERRQSALRSASRKKPAVRG